MQVLIVLPARYQSARFPGKPLAPLRGASGEVRSLIRRSWEAGCAAAASLGGDTRVVVATDDPRIRDHAAGFGASVEMTGHACRNGTERCADLLDRTGWRPDIVVNLQGDAPLTPPAFIAALTETLTTDPGAAIATPVLRCTPDALASLREDRRAGRAGGTTAVFDRQGNALYFSRELLPCAATQPEEASRPVFQHVGVYAYRPSALRDYIRWPPGALEKAEGLEQLRFLENGMRIRCREVSTGGRELWELNYPEDVARIEAALRREGIV